jgi:hypothetical protein
MSSLEKPKIEGLEFPDLPLPWEWGKRMDIATSLGMTALINRSVSEETRSQLREYVKEIKNRYLIPGAVSATLRETLIWDDSPLSKRLFTTATEADYTAMMRRFERDFLGMEPVDTTDGIRWWTSNAGGSHGVYPIEAIASLYDISDNELLNYISENSAPIGWVNARADKYLIPMKLNQHTSDTLLIDGVKELTDEGQAFVEYILISYERGFNDGNNTAPQ